MAAAIAEPRAHASLSRARWTGFLRMSAWIWSQRGDLAPPPPRKIRSTLQAVGRGVLEDVPRAAGGRLVDGAEDVAGAVGQRQADDRAAGLRVLVGRAVPLPVVADDQSLGARRHGRGLFVEHLEDVDASPLGLVLLGAGEVAAVPVEDRAGGGLAGLERVEPLDGRVGITAGRPRAEDARRATGRGGRCSSRRSRPRRRPRVAPRPSIPR